MENSTRSNCHSPQKESGEKVMSVNGNRKLTPPTEPALNPQERTAQYKLAAQAIAQDWSTNSRWNGIERPYTSEDVLRLRGSIHIEHTLARMGAERLWDLLQAEAYVNA